MWWNNGMDWGAMGGGGWVVMTVVMLAFWALVVGGVVALFRSGRSADSGSAMTPKRSAENILDERFARGEISAEEYHARRTTLRLPMPRDADRPSGPGPVRALRTMADRLRP